MHQISLKNQLVDWVIDESPLALRLHGVEFAVLMRSCFGEEDDLDLIRGFLYSEGLIEAISDLKALAPCPSRPKDQINAFLQDGILVQRERKARYLNSSCSLCSAGKIDELCQLIPKITEPIELDAEKIEDLLVQFKGLGNAFKSTGGCHIGAIFDRDLKLIGVKEDIGRHNVVDKLIGLRLRLGLMDTAMILVMSSRAGFEIIQKAGIGRFSAVVSLGAASHLAVELSQNIALPLYSFARSGHKYNAH